MPAGKTAVRFAAPFALALMIAACGTNEEPAPEPAAEAPETDNNYADAMRSRDNEAAAPDAVPDAQERPVMQAQVILDRMGFSPGVIDGEMGMSTSNALEAFQEANAAGTVRS